MFEEFDDRLKKLQEDMIRFRQIDVKYQAICKQKEALEEKVRTLQAQLSKEEADVTALEKVSLSSLFYQILGKKGERLEKEKEEAYRAKLQYDAAIVELEQVKEEYRRCESEWGELRGSERRYEQVLEEKKEALKASGDEVGQTILSLDEQITFVKGQKKEIAEAISAGKTAFVMADRILSSLDSAHGWSTWDLLGGDMISDMVKHSHLDDAQTDVYELQRCLRRFQTELSDISIQANIEVKIEGFLHFADYFFDGLLADWMVRDKIEASQEQVYRVKNQISEQLSRLDNLRFACEQRESELSGKIRGLVTAI